MIDLKTAFTNLSNQDVSHFIELTNALVMQCEASQMTLNELWDEDSCSFSVPHAMAALFNDFMDASVESRSNMNLDQFHKLIDDDLNEGVFWHELEDYWTGVFERRTSLDFIMQKSLEEQKELIRIVFVKYELHQDLPQNIDGVQFELINKVIQMLDFAKKHVIFYSRSKDFFMANFKRNYLLHDDVVEYVWNLLDEHRNAMMQKEIIERLDSLSDTQDNLVKVLNQLIQVVEKLSSTDSINNK